MSEASRSRFTITLGRTGQVVKRDGTGLEGSSSDRRPVVGSKRSVKERLGENVDSSNHFNKKRSRGDSRTDNTLDGDLRHKIIQKNVLNQSQNSKQNGVDLRDILSRPAHSSRSSIDQRDQSPEQRDTRRPYSESIDSRQQHSTFLHVTKNPKHGLQEYKRQQRPDHSEQLMHDKRESERRLPQLDDRRPHFMETMDDRPLIPMTRNSNQGAQEYRRQQIPDPTKELMHDAKESGRRIPQLDDHRSHLPETNSIRIMAQVPAPRATSTLTRAESGFDPYSPWTMERLRRRSPDEALPSSGGLSRSVVTRDADLQRRNAGRTYEVANPSTTYISKDALEFSRPTSSPYLTKTAAHVRPVRTMASVNAAPPPMSSSFAQKSPYLVDNHVTIDRFLCSLGLEKYGALFKVEEVDMYSLKRMTEIDLKTLGLPMGPRKKILVALQPRLRPQV